MEKPRTERRLGLLESLGRETLGPILVRFARWQLDTARERDVSVVLYIAREGALLKDVADTAFPASDGEAARVYARLSRRIAWGCRDVAPERLFSRRVGRSRIRSVRAALDTAPLSFDLKAQLLTDARLSLEDPLDAAHLQRLRAAVAADRDAVEGEVREQRHRLRRYVQQLGVDVAGRTGVVDIGWSATIQDAIRNVLDPTGSIHGTYLGVHPTARTDDRSSKAGFISDALRPGRSVALLRAGGALRLLETLISNDERSAYRLYDTPEGTVEAELAPYGPSPATITARAAIRRGVLATAEAMRGTLRPGAGLADDFHVESVAAIRKLLGNPSPELADALLSMTYTQDVGIGTEEPIGWRGVKTGTAWFPGLAAQTRIPGASTLVSAVLGRALAAAARRSS